MASRFDIPAGLSRRKLLQMGSLGVAGVTLPQLLQADSVRANLGLRATADSCILVFLAGGPSHIDMWDMKPDAPAEIRGEFKPIATTLPGEPFCEHMPRLAQLAHHFALIRSAHHSVNNAHAMAVYTALTGHDRGDSVINVGTAPHDYPAIGSVTGMLRPPERPIVPFVSLPYQTTEGMPGPPQPGYFGGLLGKARDPLFVLRDPNSPDFAIPELTRQSQVSESRLHTRQQLLQHLDLPITDRNDRRTTGVSGFQQQAFDLLSSPATQQAFRIDQEPAAVRDSYGRNIYGQSLLLARRLIEAGTRVVSIAWAPYAGGTWDTHGNNFRRLRNDHLPNLDNSVASLIGDLVARNMLERTLVVVMGEFGRAPKINADAGRDHWNFCYSLMMAGGGVQPGAIYGASDKIGAYPIEKPTTPAAIVATIYKALGIPHTFEFHDITGRPYVLNPWGEPLNEILV